MGLVLDRRREATMALITEDTFTAATTSSQDWVLNLFISAGLSHLCSGRMASYRKVLRLSKTWKCLLHRTVYAARHEARYEEYQGGNASWIVAAHGCEEFVNVLAQRTDVNVNSRSINGRSPRFWPSSAGNVRIVAILMEAGTDLILVDVNRDTAVAVARKNRYGKSRQYARTFGERTDCFESSVYG